MKKIILMLWIIGILLVSGCDDNSQNYNYRDWCRENIETIDCKQLLKCDANCDKLDINSHKNACHLSFTNRIIVECNTK